MSTVSGAVVTLVTANEEGECEFNRSLKEVNGETANCCRQPVGSEPLSCLTAKQRWVKATCRLQDAGHKSVFFGDQEFVYFTGNTTVGLGFILYPFSVHIVTITFHYQLMHLLTL